MNFTISPWKNLGWITVFAIAMGFLETAVVVYLRVLLYPGGFSFPLAIMPHSLAIIEIYREAATLVMLIGIGYLSGKNGTTRFAFFLYAFAVWDLFYYVFLKIFIHWPESWMTWDILFLIPTNWVGPVVAPIGERHAERRDRARCVDSGHRRRACPCPSRQLRQVPLDATCAIESEKDFPAREPALRAPST